MRRRAGVGPGDLPGWKHAEQQRRGDGRGQNEGQHQRVEGESHVETRVGFRDHPHERAVKNVGDGDGGHASDGGQRQTLRDELADEPSAARAERQAQGDFGFARGAAREQKVGQIRARDQQQDADRGQQRGQRLRELAARRRRSARAGPDSKTLIEKVAAAVADAAAP